MKWLLIIMFMLSFSLAYAITDPSRISITSGDSRWLPVSATGIENQLSFWSVNAKDKKTELGWIPQSNDCSGWPELFIYDENNNQILDDKNKAIKLKCESSKCDGNNCYHISLTNAQAVNIDDFIKLGDTSFYTVYQNASRVQFDAGGFFINATIYKAIAGEFQLAPNELFVDFSENKWKFGAEDIYNTGLERYKYLIESDRDLIVDRYGMRYNNYKIDFNDICKEIYAECYIETFSNAIQVMFYSDRVIDPVFERIYSSPGEYVNNVTFPTYGQLNSSVLELDNATPYNHLVSYWSFDVDAQNQTSFHPNDYGPTKKVGTGQGHANVTREGCNYHQCLNLDGTGDWITFNEGATQTYKFFGQTQWSMSAWVKTTEGTDAQSIFSYYSLGGGPVGPSGYDFRMRFGNLSMRIGDAAAAEQCHSSLNISDGNWHFVGFHYNKTDSVIRWYKDNGETDSCDITKSLSFAPGPIPVIGAYTTGGTPFEGQIDEMMIFNTSLTPQQFLDIYNNQSARFKPKGIQVPTFTNTGSGYNRFTLNISDYLLLFSTNLSARIRQWDMTKGFNESETDLLAYYHFDNDCSDSSDYGNDCEFYGNPTNSSGRINQSIALDGTGDYINISTLPDFNTSRSFALSLWFNTSADPAQNNKDLIHQSWCDFGAGGNGWSMQHSGFGADKLVLRTWNSNFGGCTRYSSSISSHNTKPGEWNHLAISYSNYTKNMFYYLNGEYTGGAVNLGIAQDNTPNSEKVIGKGHPGGATANLIGQIDEFFYFNRSLSDSEVKSLYSCGNLDCEKDNVVGVLWGDYGASQFVTGSNTFKMLDSSEMVNVQYTLHADSNRFYTPILDTTKQILESFFLFPLIPEIWISGTFLSGLFVE